MTDNEITTALRAVAEKYKGKFVATCETNISEMATDAANHIERLCDESNRLKAEIESLQAENEEQHQAIINALKHMAEIKPKAIKEFAERLKEEMLKSKYTITVSSYSRACNAVLDFWIEEIDNFVKRNGERK